MLSERSSVTGQHTCTVVDMITILTSEDDICDDVTNYFPAVTGTYI